MKVDTVMNSTLLVTLFGVVGSSISTPGRLTKLYTDSRIFRFLYFFMGAYAGMKMSVPKTIIAVLVLLAFYDLMRSGRNDPYKPFYGSLTS